MKSLLILAMPLVMLGLLCGCNDSNNDTTPPVTPPATPTNLAVTEVGFSNIILGWNASDSATGYIVYRSDTQDGTYEAVRTEPTTAWIDTGLPYGSTFWYKVSAVNAGGESEPCAALQAMTTVPTGFTVTGSPGGNWDYDYTYNRELGSYPLYQSTPIGLNIMVPLSGEQAGLWCIHDQIEGIVVFYHPTPASYPPVSGWIQRVGGTATGIAVLPF